MLKRRARLSSKAGSLLIALVLTGAWAMERWGPGLLPAEWHLPGSAQSCRLDRVLDGDSIRLICPSGPVEVRLHCIDAPEKDQRPWGDRARAHLRKVTPQELELVSIEKDRFERIVGEVFTTGADAHSLNLEQVRSGHAAVYDRYCDDPLYYRAESEARAARRGIWQRSGEHQTPWIFRHRRS